MTSKLLAKPADFLLRVPTIAAEDVPAPESPRSTMKLETLEDVKQWIAEHDGRITAYWEAQHAWNVTHDEDDRRYQLKVDAQLGVFGSRLLAVEKKIIWFCALAAAGGGALGQFIQNVAG